MTSNIFRKASVERMNSPEQLNEYIRVTNPSVWLILSAIVLLLIGILVWAVFGTIDTMIDTGLVVDGGTAVCYVSGENAPNIAPGMTVTCGDSEGEVVSVSSAPSQYSGKSDASALYLSGIAADDFAYQITVSISGIDDGVYPAEITVDSVSAISFIID